MVAGNRVEAWCVGLLDVGVIFVLGLRLHVVFVWGLGLHCEGEVLLVRQDEQRHAWKKGGGGYED